VQAVALYQESLTQFQATQHLWGQGVNLYRLGTVLLEQGDVTEAPTLLHKSLAIFRQFGDKGSEAAVMVSLGSLARDLGDYRSATEHTQAGLRLYREVGNKHGFWWAINVLGDIVLLGGDSGLARAFVEAGAALVHDFEASKISVATEHRLRALMAREAGDHERAVALLRQRLALYYSIGSESYIILGMEELAAAASMPGFADYAARLWGAAERVRETLGHLRATTIERRLFERSVASIHSAIGEASMAAAWAEGRAMTLDQAVTYAVDASSART
jgi:tetratricopeptide (TPR) repeat protein